jgi:ParB family transcriptional regulator, chromosome partitioning protein
MIPRGFPLALSAGRSAGHGRSKADQELNAAAQTWAHRLPEKVDQLWDWLIEQPQHVILDLLAFVVAQTINAVQLPHQQSDEGHLAGANTLSKALGLEMANWWAPTAENYFSRIKKEQIIAAIYRRFRKSRS